MTSSKTGARAGTAEAELHIDPALRPSRIRSTVRATVPGVLFLVWVCAGLYLYAYERSGWGVAMLIVSLPLLFFGGVVISGRGAGAAVAGVAYLFYMFSAFFAGKDLVQDIVLNIRGETATVVIASVTHDYQLTSTGAGDPQYKYRLTTEDGDDVRGTLSSTRHNGHYEHGPYEKGDRIRALIDPGGKADARWQGNVSVTRDAIFLGVVPLVVIVDFVLCGVLWYRGGWQTPYRRAAIKRARRRTAS